jgi:hypothetical protein
VLGKAELIISQSEIIPFTKVTMELSTDVAFLIGRFLSLKDLVTLQRVCRSMNIRFAGSFEKRMKNHLYMWKKSKQHCYGKVRKDFNTGSEEKDVPFCFNPNTCWKNDPSFKVDIPWTWSTILAEKFAQTMDTQFFIDDCFKGCGEVLDAIFVEGKDIQKLGIFDLRTQLPLITRYTFKKDVAVMYFPFILFRMAGVIANIRVQIRASYIKKVQVRYGYLDNDMRAFVRGSPKSPYPVENFQLNINDSYRFYYNLSYQDANLDNAEYREKHGYPRSVQGIFPPSKTRA